MDRARIDLESWLDRRRWRLIAYLLYLGVTGTTFLLFLDSSVSDSGFHGAYALVFILSVTVPVCVVIRSRLDLVDPLYWFSAMYYLIVPGSVYLISTEFAYSQHLLDFSREHLILYTERALTLFLIGYLAFLVGYLAFSGRPAAQNIRLPNNGELSGWIGRIVVVVCLAVGAANFVYLASSYPGGPVQYLLAFGLRAHRFDAIEGYITTVGYNFAYCGSFLWMLLIFRLNPANRSRSEVALFCVAVVMILLMAVSQGRISQTVMYVLTLVTLFYGVSANIGKTMRLAGIALLVIFLAPVLYILRRLSASVIGQAAMPAAGDLSQTGSALAQALGYWLVDRGNIPNLPMVVNLIGQDGIDGKILYGETFGSWVTRISSRFGDSPNVAEMLGARWYGLEGGVPPTIIGEMLANFGYLGVPLGMLLAGGLCGCLYRYLRGRYSFVGYFIYISLLVKFVFFWPKGEVSNVVSAIWQIAFMLSIYYAVVLVTRAGRSSVIGEFTARSTTIQY